MTFFLFSPAQKYKSHCICHCKHSSMRRRLFLRETGQSQEECNFFFCFLKNIYFWQRDRQTDRQNLKQAPGRELLAWARSRARTHEPQDRDLSQSWTLNRWSHPGAPQEVCKSLHAPDRFRNDPATNADQSLEDLKHKQFFSGALKVATGTPLWRHQNVYCMLSSWIFF